jgi:segregation and condensation protein A
MQAAFSVKTGHFEGPLDLLLSLIEERKLLVSDVSLAQVADDFLNYVSTHDAFPLADTAHFLVVASTLLLLKSRALLPVLTLTDDEEGDIKDLELRLALLKVIRTAAQQCAHIQLRTYITDGVPITEPLFVVPRDLTPDALYQAARAVIQSAPKTFVRDEVDVPAVVSLDEMIERLTERVQRAISMTFTEFTGDTKSAHEVVVGFLALLELVKRGFADVNQDAHFREITIEYAGTLEAPRYE